MKLIIMENHAGVRKILRTFSGSPGITFCEREVKPNRVTMPAAT